MAFDLRHKRPIRPNFEALRLTQGRNTEQGGGRSGRGRAGGRAGPGLAGGRAGNPAAGTTGSRTSVLGWIAGIHWGRGCAERVGLNRRGRRRGRSEGCMLFGFGMCVFVVMLVGVGILERGQPSETDIDAGKIHLKATINLFHQDQTQFQTQSQTQTQTQTQVGKKSVIFPNHGVVITGLARDIQPHIPKLVDNIDTIRGMFGRSLVIIFENGSKDNTRQILEGWFRGKDGVLIVGSQEFDSVSRREVRLAAGRNKILAYMRRHDVASVYTYWINMDLDDVMSVKEMDPDAIASSMNLVGGGQHGNKPKWDVVCSNTWPTWYYDRFALRTREGPFRSIGCKPAENCHEGRPVDLSRWFPFNPSVQGGNPHKNIYKGIPRNHSSWLQVESCFGGMAIYKTQVITGAGATCRYRGLDDCEHVTFHQCLTQISNASIWINPKFVPFHLREEEVPHSPRWAQLQTDKPI